MINRNSYFLKNVFIKEIGKLCNQMSDDEKSSLGENCTKLVSDL